MLVESEVVRELLCRYRQARGELERLEKQAECIRLEIHELERQLPMDAIRGEERGPRPSLPR